MQPAINMALTRILESDERALVFGEDVGRYGGVFRVTQGLQKRFGERRVFDTPLGESGILGVAVGLTMASWHPIPEVQFDGFALPAFNQIVSQAGRLHHRTRGAFNVQLTLRMPSFGGIGAPEHHSESFEALFAHIPGLKLVSPSRPSDAYALLVQAVADPDPVIYMEPKSRYWHREAFEPDAVDVGPLGTGCVARAGKHLTLVSWGASVAICMEAADAAAEDGVDVEVIDLRWLKPYDLDLIAASVDKTRRLVVVQEAPISGGFASEVSAATTERCFARLVAPAVRIGGPDVPYPPGALEDVYMPSVDRVLTGMQRVLEYGR
jgi:pyruvate dehydrogenase E1 component beta subunit